MIPSRMLMVLLVVAFAATACLTEARGFLAFNIDSPCTVGLQPACPPDTTTTSSVTISGQVVRAPPRQDVVLVVQAVNETDTVTMVTDNFGFFDIEVQLRKDEENEIVLSADDGTEATTERRTFIIVREEPILGVSQPTPRR